MKKFLISCFSGHGLPGFKEATDLDLDGGVGRALQDANAQEGLDREAKAKETSVDRFLGFGFSVQGSVSVLPRFFVPQCRCSPLNFRRIFGFLCSPVPLFPREQRTWPKGQTCSACAEIDYNTIQNASAILVL